MARRSLGITLVLCLSLASAARADDEDTVTDFGDRPTSGDPSVISGRTNGNGETVIAVRAGWPGLGAEAIFAPSSRLSVGPRIDLVYGGPLMAFPTGIGAAFSVPFRFHVFGRDRFDLAITARPDIALAQGRLLGESLAFQNVFGMAYGSSFGARLGFEVKEGITLVAGIEGEVHGVSIPNASESFATGAITFVAGVEGMLSMSTMLFAELQGGYGFAPSFAFGGDRGVLRLFVGVGFVL